jgi:hypothetical protein
MRKNGYTPTEEDLEIAWRIKKNHGTIATICKKLKITKAQYARVRPVFNNFIVQARRKLKHKTDKIRPGTAIKYSVMKKLTERSGTYYKGGELKLKPEDIDLDVLRSYVICGFTKDKIAALLGISRGTLLKLTNMSQDVYDAVYKAKQEVAADIVQKGLLFLCKKHKIKSTHFASYKGEITTKKCWERHVPNLGAIKYILANTIGWKNENQNQTVNNKGAILRMIDEIASYDESEEDISGQT